MKKIEDVKFARTVAADIELAKLCPDEDINKLGSLLREKNTIKKINNIMKVIVILSEAYENKMHFENPEYIPDPITMEQLTYTTDDDVLKLSNQAFAQFYDDGKSEVQAESKKEKAE